MVVPKGQQVYKLGARMEIMQKNELIEIAREW